MTELQRIFAFGVMLNSALYLEACFMAGLFLSNPVAWRLAIAAMGVTYLSYSTQFVEHWSRRYLLIASIVLGAAAGLSLLV
jgi:hypothetical protein